MQPLWVATAGAAGFVAAGYGAWRARFGKPPPGLPAVLAYHKVGTPELGGTWCSQRQLRAQLDSLQRAGYVALDAGLYERRVQRFAPGCMEGTATGSRAGLARAAERVGTPAGAEVLLTFDDAFESFATHAWPELSARRMPALLFVITDYVGRRSSWDLSLPGRHVPHLDWAALRELVAGGVGIGSHSSTHRDLRRLEPAELERELLGSRGQLEDALGLEVRSISYPFGRADARVRAAAARAGYRVGFSMCPPGSNRRIDPLALRRSGVYVTDTAATVLQKVDPSRHGFWIQDITGRAINSCATLVSLRSQR